MKYLNYERYENGFQILSLLKNNNFISVIELACGEYGEDKIETLVAGTQNGKSLQWFDNLLESNALRGTLAFKIFDSLIFN